MGSVTGIAWTDATWNPVRGCSRVSEGCRHCYAEEIAARFSRPGQPFEGFAEHPAYSYGSPAACHRPARPTWTGRVELVSEKLEEPLRWRKPRRVFVNSMSDLFHEQLSFPDIASVFGIMASARQHTFQVLTKRPERMREWFGWISGRNDELNLIDTHADEALLKAGHPAWKFSMPGGTAWPLPNVWLGVSVEDQKTADERIPILLQTPAAIRFVSYEPALGPVNLAKVPGLNKAGSAGQEITRRFWVIAGGESGAKARACDVAWFRSVRDQCRIPGVPFFMKQRGALWYDSERREGVRRSCVVSAMAFVSDWQWVSQKDRAGADPSEWPEDLRVREFPEMTRG